MVCGGMASCGVGVGLGLVCGVLRVDRLRYDV